MNLFSYIKKVLELHPNFSANGNILKNKVVEAALKLDGELLSVLIKDSRTKAAFFQDVDGILVFDKVKFQKFISNKEFLPGSFTAFKNKIGLTSHGEFIAKKNDVVLNFPFKDCVLEGGQTKEDEKSKEIFWNETLSPDEIDRMFDPKVFTNWRRFNEEGEHIAGNISKDDSFILKGNNLIVLHSLAEIYSGGIKLIYIDPPYNTGNDGFQYNDSFNHSTWLTFMKNRLEIAWKLLKTDGSIFIQVDDNEFAYLKVLCDEVFGRDHFRETIVLKSSTESGVNAINVKRGERLFKVKEYILFYSKNPAFRFKPFFTKSSFNFNYKYQILRGQDGYEIRDVYKDFKKSYEDVPLSNSEKNVLAKAAFAEYALAHSENIYSLEKNIKKAGEKFKNFAAENKLKGIVEEFTNSNGETVLVYDGGSLISLKERVIKEDNAAHFGVLASDLWVDIGTTPASEGVVSFGNGKKPEKLLQRIIEMATEPGDTVLDYHLGSGTTAAVAHKLGRKFIGIEQMDYGENDSIIRLKNVVNGEQSGISKNIGWKGGGSFITAELAKQNEKLIEKIIDEKDEHKLQNYLHEIVGVENHLYNLIFEGNYREEFAGLQLLDKKKFLISILDKNLMYIDYSDVQDEDYNISTEDQMMNKAFYNM